MTSMTKMTMKGRAGDRATWAVAEAKARFSGENGRVPAAWGCDAQAGERKDTAGVLVHSPTSPQSTQASLATEGFEAVGNVPASGSRNRIGARGRILWTTTVNFH